jgi:beta-xylosidase
MWARAVVAACCAVVLAASPAWGSGVVRIKAKGARHLHVAATGTYQNPVFGSFPDPMAQFTGVEYYAYSTGSRFPVIRSTDLVNWTAVGTAFTTSPRWSSGNPWAPSVLADPHPCADRPAGSTSTTCFYLYYVGLDNALATPANCIGVATADQPAGPFRDKGILTRSNGTVDPVRGRIGCGDSGGYSNIDPAPYVTSGGTPYLYLSTGHEPGGAWRRTLSAIQLSSDRIHAAGSRQALLTATRSWEAGVVEGPWVIRRNSAYYLFYSGGSFADASYAMGYATALSPTGTFTKASANPILKSTPQVIGPGGGSVTTSPSGADWMLYHGSATVGGARTLRIDPLVWSGTRVTVRGPTTGPQPAP